jgi:hypothetical protein
LIFGFDDFVAVSSSSIHPIEFLHFNITHFVKPISNHSWCCPYRKKVSPCAFPELEPPHVSGIPYHNFEASHLALLAVAEITDYCFDSYCEDLQAIVACVTSSSSSCEEEPKL